MGDLHLKQEHKESLYMELMSLEDRGITIWLEGYPGTSESISSQVCAQDESTYMRDYIFDEGVLREIHFDKVKKELL